jgi:hypothetical protein
MKKSGDLFLVFVLIFLSTSVLLAQDANEKARTLTPGAEKSLVYVIRPSSAAFAVRLPVNVDDKPIATLGAHDFGFITLDPGKHSFKVVNGTSKATLFDVTTEAGKIYYLEVEMKMGAITARGVLKAITEEEGKKFLKKCEVAGNNQEKL